MNKYTQALESITALMVNANLAIPIIFGAISGIAAIIKFATGQGPTLAELADLIDGQLKANDEFGKAEIERLRQQLG